MLQMSGQRHLLLQITATRCQHCGLWCHIFPVCCFSSCHASLKSLPDSAAAKKADEGAHRHLKEGFKLKKSAVWEIPWMAHFHPNARECLKYYTTTTGSVQMLHTHVLTNRHSCVCQCSRQSNTVSDAGQLPSNPLFTSMVMLLKAARHMHTQKGKKWMKMKCGTVRWWRVSWEEGAGWGLFTYRAQLFFVKNAFLFFYSSDHSHAHHFNFFFFVFYKLQCTTLVFILFFV